MDALRRRLGHVAAAAVAAGIAGFALLLIGALPTPGLAPLVLEGASVDGDALTLQVRGGPPDRVSLRKVDLDASLAAGFDPDAAAPTVTRLRWAGAERAEPKRRADKLECGTVAGVCRIAPLAESASGAFWIRVARGKAVAQALVVRSSLDAWSRGDEARWVVHALDEGGAPVGGAEVRIWRGKRAIARGATSFEGLAMVDGKEGPGIAWITVRAPSGDLALLRHSPGPLPESEIGLALLTDRAVYAPGDDVRVFGTVGGFPHGVSAASLDWTAGSTVSGRAVLALTPEGTFDASFRLPDDAGGMLRMIAHIGADASPSNAIVVPIAGPSRIVRGASRLAPPWLRAGEPLRAVGPRWTKELERAGGVSVIRAVPFGAIGPAAAAAGAALYDPGELVARAVERSVELRFHGDVRYEVPFDALSAFGEPSVAYVRVEEKRAPATKAGASAAGRVLWSFVVYAAGSAPPPPLAVPEPDDTRPVTFGRGYVRAGAAIPMKARLGPTGSGVAILEDRRILAAVTIGGATPLIVPAEGAWSPRVVTDVAGDRDEGIHPLISAARYLGIEIREVAGGIEIALHDAAGAPVDAHVALVMQHEDVLPPLSGWAPPPAVVWPDSPCRATDAEAVDLRVWPPVPPPVIGSRDVKPPTVEVLPELAEPEPLLWVDDLEVKGTAFVPWTRPAGPALLRITILAADATRVGKRVTFVAVEPAP